MRLYKLFIFLFFLSIQTQAEPPYKTHLHIGIDENRNGLPDNGPGSRNCNTVSPKELYDSQTAVTFWGDSRIDLVDNIVYGAGSLDSYFAADGWNVQNFGVSGRQSIALNQEVKECFLRETEYIAPKYDGSNNWIGGGDQLKPYYPNFKVSKNVAFEIGGNDFFLNIYMRCKYVWNFCGIS